MGKRQEVEEFIINNVNKILPDKSNEKLYRDLFEKMSDKEFVQFMSDLKTKKKELVVICPNFKGNTGLNTTRNLKIAKELGVRFFKRIWIPSDGSHPKYLSPIPYMVIDLPVRRVSQLLDKKMSVPEDQDTVDILTGQPTGKSKGAKVNYAELQVLAALGLDNSISELIKMRGGDEGGYRAMISSLKSTGHVDLNVAKQYSTGVESTRTLKTILTGCHLQSNL